MPTIDTKNKRIIYDEKDWLSGLYYTNGTMPQKFGNFSYSQISYNPYINLGYAQASYLQTNFTDSASVTSAILNVVVDGQSAYGIDAKNLLHKLTIFPPAVVTTGFPHTITPHGAHTGVKGSDVCIYYHNVSGTRTKSLFYSWYDGTDGDIGKFDLSSTFDDDYMSTVPASGAVLATGSPHPLIVGYDDILYIGNGRYLNAYDGATGTNGTYYPNVLTLPEGYEIISMSKLQPKSLVIFAYNKNTTGTIARGESKAFFWDYLSLDPYQIEDLSDNTVTESFEYKGSVGCFTYGREDFSKLKIFDGSGFKTVCIYSGIGPCHGGCDVNDNEIYFNVMKNDIGHIYCYGNNYKLNNVLNSVYKLDGGTSYQSGFFKILSNLSIAGSTGKDNAGGGVIQYMNKSAYSNGSLWKSGLTDIGDERIQIKEVTVYFADEFTGGRTLSIYLKDRYANHYIKGLVDLATVTTTNRIYRVKPYNYTGNTPIIPLDGIGLGISWNQGSGSSACPIINKIIIDYEPIKIN